MINVKFKIGSPDLSSICFLLEALAPDGSACGCREHYFHIIAYYEKAMGETQTTARRNKTSRWKLPLTHQLDKLNAHAGAEDRKVILNNTAPPPPSTALSALQKPVNLRS